MKKGRICLISLSVSLEMCQNSFLKYFVDQSISSSQNPSHDRRKPIIEKGITPDLMAFF